MAKWLFTGILFFLMLWLCKSKATESYFAEVRNPDGKSKAKVLVLWGRGLGEEELLARMKIAALKQGIQLSSASVRPPFMQRIWLKDPFQEAVNRCQPDFIFSLQEEVEPVAGIPNYLWVSKSEQALREQLQRDPILKEKLKGYDGFLCAFDDTESLHRVLSEQGLSGKVGRWFPSVYSMEFKEANRTKLFYCGANWDERRSGGDYREMFKKIDEKGYLKVYGLPSKWKHTPNSFGGHLPSDGLSILNAMTHCGVALVLHSDAHNRGGAISSRIFESSAASCVTISDPHPFVKEHFGDNVLYLDTNQNAHGLFTQVEGHLKWIQEHPEEAKEMARRCHEIATQQFNLERQMEGLLDFHSLRAHRVATQSPQTPAQDSFSG